MGISWIPFLSRPAQDLPQCFSSEAVSALLREALVLAALHVAPPPLYATKNRPGALLSFFHFCQETERDTASGHVKAAEATAQRAL